MKEQKIRSEMSMQKLRLENEFNERIANISRSVAHDIRSPLSVLNIIGDKMKTDFPEEGQLLGEVSKRIIQIADGLLDASRKSVPKESDTRSVVKAEPIVTVSTQSITRICEQAVAEKKLEFGASLVPIQSLYGSVVSSLASKFFRYSVGASNPLLTVDIALTQINRPKLSQK